MEASDVTKQGGAQEPGQPVEAKAGSGEVVLRTAYPHDRFEHNVKGAEPITAQGTAVPKGKVKALQDAAEESGLKLEEVDA